jgi:hypothetical protein
MIDKAGLYDDVADEAYHRDPVQTPSLSSSVAKTIIAQSPRHAWFAHPRLNRALLDEIEKVTPAMDVGTAAHKLILGKGREIKEIVADDFKTKAAREARDAARAAGLVPILSDRMAGLRLQREAFFDQIQGTEVADLFNDGVGEVTGVWQDLEDTWCRMRIDWLPNKAREGGHIDIIDVKTTAGSAAPEDWQRIAFDMGFDIQDAFYQRGIRETIPGVRSVTMYLAVLEQEPPNGLSIFKFGGQAYAEAEACVDMAVSLWSTCLEQNKWPGYQAATTFIDPPKWRTARAKLREMGMHRYVEIMNRPHVKTARAAAE